MKITLKLIRGHLIPYSDEDFELLKKLQDGAIYEIDIKNIDTRTLQQNKALHKWCDLIANQLNDSGLYVTDVLKMETQWSMSKVKENIFKPVVKQLYNKNSTTKLKKDEFENIIDAIVKAFAQKGIVVPDFPNREVNDE